MLIRTPIFQCVCLWGGSVGGESGVGVGFMVVCCISQSFPIASLHKRFPNHLWMALIKRSRNLCPGRMKVNCLQQPQPNAVLVPGLLWVLGSLSTTSYMLFSVLCSVIFWDIKLCSSASCHKHGELYVKRYINAIRVHVPCPIKPATYRPNPAMACLCKTGFVGPAMLVGSCIVLGCFRATTVELMEQQTIWSTEPQILSRDKPLS